MSEQKTVKFPVKEYHPINATIIKRVLTVCATKVFNQFRKRRLGCTCRLPFGMIVKANKGITIAEAHTLRFISQNTTIPVPRIICAFKRKGVSYIVQEEVDGLWLSDGWKKRSEESKDKILALLKTYVDQLRNLEPPPGIGVQNVMGGPLRDIKVSFANKPFGPFPTIAAFHQWLRSNWEPPQPEDYDGTWPETLKACCMVWDMHRSMTWPLKFSHADLNYSNILVSGDKITAVLDWESAGWYPAYWEYARARIDTRGPHTLAGYVEKWLEPFPDELEMEFERGTLFEQ